MGTTNEAYNKAKLKARAGKLTPDDVSVLAASGTINKGQALQLRKLMKAATTAAPSVAPIVTPETPTEEPTEEPAVEKPILDLIMWVGRGYYTEETFIAEANTRGACKRVGGLPALITIGKSRVFLAHDWTNANKERGKPGTPRIFGYFTIDSILVVGASSLLEKYDLDAKHLQPLDPKDLATFPDRGCGKLVAGGMYLVSNDDMKKLQAHAKMARGTITLMKPTPIVEKSLKRFRGYKYIAGDVLLTTRNVAEAEKMAAKIKDEMTTKPKTPSLKDIILKVVADNQPISRQDAVAKAIELRAPTSKRPEWVYNDVIRVLRRDKKIILTKTDGQQTLTIAPAETPAETETPVEAETAELPEESTTD